MLRAPAVFVAAMFAAVTAFPVDYSFTHFAGTTGGGGYHDGFGTDARFYLPRAITVDKNGNIYVAEQSTVRRITVSGKVTTFAGKYNAPGAVNGAAGVARVRSIYGIVADSAGNVFIAEYDNCNVRKITPAGVVSDFAGLSGNCSVSDGLGTAARLYYPVSLAIDASDNLYVGEISNVIRKITPAGNVTTLAGQAFQIGTADGTGGTARFWGPFSLAVDSASNVYVADSYNHTLRRVTPAGVVTTIAGEAGSAALVDGTGSSARFNYPWALTIDRTDTLYLMDYYGYAVRRVTTSGVVSTIVGALGSQGYTDGNATTARFRTSEGIATDRGGNLLVAETWNHTIRKITASGDVTTFAGLPVLNSQDVDAIGTAARFRFPREVTADSGSNLYVTDEFSATIRKITPAGVVTTFAGGSGYGGADGTGTMATFQGPIGIASDSSGNLYVADSQGRTVRKISPAGVVTTLAGSFNQSGIVDGNGSSARFEFPHSLAVDSSGNVWVTEFYSHVIRKITPAGDVTTFAGAAGACASTDAVGTAARFCNPRGIAVGAGGNLFVTDYGNHTIRQINPVTGAVSTYAGLAGSYGTADGTGAAARFYYPVGLAFDGTALVMTDNSNTVRRIESGAVVTTIAGAADANNRESMDGTALAARIYGPDGLFVLPSGIGYVVEREGGAVLAMRAAIGDAATAIGSTVGSPTQLNTSPQTATSWTWSVLRRPTGSIANLSSASIRNPTFTPDLPDLYTFLLKAESASGVRYSTVDVLATGACTSTLTGVTIGSSGSSTFCASATGGSASITGTSGGGLELSYRWGYRTVSGGAVTDIPGANSTSYVFNGPDLGGSGTRYIVVTVTPACGVARISNEVVVNVQPAPSSTITAPSTVQGMSSGNVASVPNAGVGAVYSWSISGGSITSGAGTNAITFSVRNSSPATLSVTVTAGGCTSSSSQIVAVNELPYTFLHFAGANGGIGAVDGAGTTARLRGSQGVTVDKNGTIYFTDTNNTVRRMSATGRISTLAGLAETLGMVNATGSAARFNSPFGIVVDDSGNVFVADSSNRRIRKITPAGVVTTFAGSGALGGADGTGTAAEFRFPSGLAIDSAGNLFVGDGTNHTIRKITPAGVVTTIAGLAGTSGSANGTGPDARFNNPRGVAVDSSGNVYVADASNHMIRKITPAGVVTTLAGATSSGSVDGNGTAARFINPFGVAVDASGNVYVVETNGHRLRKITPAGDVTTLAGQLSPTASGYADATGSAARFATPIAVAVLPGGDLLISETGNATIRRVTPAGVVTTAIGAAAIAGSVDATGDAARLNNPFGLALASDGSIYFSDTSTHVIRKVTSAGVVTTVAGSAGVAGSTNGNGSAARFNAPGGVAIDGLGNVYVADRSNHTIRKITPAGDVTTFAGQAGSAGSADGSGTAAQFSSPTAIAVDSLGNFFITDRGNHTIRKMTAAGVVTTFAGLAQTAGNTDGTGSAARFDQPLGLAVDGSDNVYVADTNNHAIRKITPAGVVTTILDSTDGTFFPSAVAVDIGGDVFIGLNLTSDTRIFKYSSVSAALSGVGGVTTWSGSTDGTGSNARLRNVNQILIDFNGNLYLTEGANHAIRVARPTPLPDEATGPSPIAAGSTAALDTTPQTATTWSWSIIRRPAGSSASFSNPAVRNPTFTPDMPDLYTLMVRAENVAGVRYSTINLTATGSCSPPLSGVTASLMGSASFCATQNGGTASAVVTGGADVAYRWGWRSSPGGAITDITGANDASYLIKGADLGGSGTKYLVVTVVPACGSPMVSNEIVLSVSAAPDATITTPSSVNGFSTGNTASVPNAGPGAAYAWTIGNGTITGGAGTRVITYEANNTSPLTLGVTVTAGGCSNSSSTNVTVVEAPYTFEHAAGSLGGAGTFDGTGMTARFNGSRHVAIDANGTLYVADSNNHVIRTISRSGEVRTLAGLSGACGAVDGTGSAARFCSPMATAVDSSGNVWVTDNGAIRRITPTGVVTTFAGQSGSFGSTDGTGSGARFGFSLWGIAIDSGGNLYVSDGDFHTVRKITSGAAVTTLAGVAGSSGHADGTGPAARLNFPMHMAIDAAGLVYLSDRGNQVIRTVTNTGTVTTIAGTVGTFGYLDGPAATARFSFAEGVAVDESGNVYVADQSNARIRKISDGYVSTLAGGGNVPNVDGAGTAARFSVPLGIACDRNGDLYVNDNGLAIRKVTPEGVVTTLAGQIVTPGWEEGTGTGALFNNVRGVAIDSGGTAVVADQSNHTIRKITPAGVTTTFAGFAGLEGGTNGAGSAARFRFPTGVAIDGSGNVYIANTSGHTIRKITPAGAVTTLAGSHNSAGNVDGTGSGARFNGPRGLVVDSAGNVYVADGGNHRIRAITPAGVVTTLAGSIAGLLDGTGAAARFNSPQDVALESSGDLLVADTNNQRIRRVTAAGVVTTIVPTNPNGTAFGNLRAHSIAIDNSNNAYLVDGSSHVVRKMTAAGVVTTIGGGGGGGAIDGTGTFARFNAPLGIDVDPAGETIYITDTSNAAVRVGRLTRMFDIATISSPTVTAGSSVQLDTAPQTAASWTWSVIRQPAGSSAALSSTTVRNPTFTPDIADRYTFLLRAEGPLGIRYSTVDLTATGSCTPVLASAIASIAGSSTFCTSGTGGTASVAVTGGGLVSYRWGYRSVSGGAIIDIPGATGSSYVARGADISGTGTRYLVVTVTPGCGTPMISNEIPVTITTAPNATITAPAFVLAKSTGLVASVPNAGGGASYSWTITSGQITGGASTRQITFSAGNDTPIQLTASVTVGSCTNTSTTTITVSTLPYTFTLLAGPAGGIGNYDGQPQAARFNRPIGLAMDRNGNGYVSDYSSAIRKVSPSGVVTTLAGVPGAPCGLVDGTRSAARFCYPEGLAVDADGYVFVADTYNNVIRRITPDGVVTTIAGSGAYGHADGTGAAAQFSFPFGITVHPDGMIYVADRDTQTIRQVTPAGVVTTIAGSPFLIGSADGTGSAARFFYPWDITNDGGSYLYVADYWNHMLRRIDRSTQVVTTLAGAPGGGYADGAGTAARFTRPATVAMHPSGDIIICDSVTGHLVRRVTPAGVVSTVAGAYNVNGSTDGPAVDARFNDPSGVAVDATGSIFVLEYGNNDIRRITPAGIVSTFVGTQWRFGSTDGPGTAASFDGPYGVAVDASGNVYVSDHNNHTIRRITPAGMVSTFAGMPGEFGTADGMGSSARFRNPRGLVFDAAGNLYVADATNSAIRRITPAGMVTTFAGTIGLPGHAEGGLGIARFNHPIGLTIDGAGNVYATDYNNAAIRKITPAGVVSTLAGRPMVGGYSDGPGAVAMFSGPHGITIDPDGNLYVADAFNHRIRKVTPSGDVSTVTGFSAGWVDGSKVDARLNTPTAIVIDPFGVLHVGDQYNHRVRKVMPDGSVTTIGGQELYGNAEGTANTAMLGDPAAIAMDAAGNLYVADVTNYNIRLGRITTLGDSAIALNPDVAVGVTVNLDATPQTVGTTYQWSVIRQPAGSGAQLSSSTVRNPTFTPDIAETYTFLLRAENGGNIRYSTVDVTVTGACTPLSSATATVDGATTVCATGFGGTASASATGGAGLSYRWGYRTVSAGTITDIPGANSSTYLISGADFGGSGTRYLVVTVTPGCGTPMVSNETTITVGPALSAVSISVMGSTTVSPSSTGGTATLTFSGGGTVTQQWGYRTVSGGAITNIAGQTATTYVINGSHFPSVGTYYLVATATPTCGIVTTSNEIVVTVGSSVPTNVDGEANAAGNSIHLTWTAAIGATSYEVLRSTGGGVFSVRTTTSSTSFDDAASPNSSYLYKIHVVGGGDSANAYVGTFIFTDVPVTSSTPIKAVHFMELRAAVNTMRTLAGLPAAVFTDPALSSGMIIKRIHLIELRTAMGEARAALDVAAVVYAEPDITAGVTTAKVDHLQEVRGGVR